MPRRLIETDDQKVARMRGNIVIQLENARRELGLAKRYLDAPQSDPYWESWSDRQRSDLAVVQADLTQLQLKIRQLTLKFHDVTPKKAIVEVKKFSPRTAKDCITCGSCDVFFSVTSGINTGRIVCRECGRKGRVRTNMEEAIKIWNKD